MSAPGSLRVFSHLWRYLVYAFLDAVISVLACLVVSKLRKAKASALGGNEIAPLLADLLFATPLSGPTPKPIVNGGRL